MWARSWYLHSIVLAFLLASEAFSQQGIPWQTDLQNARQRAGVSNRLVLVHFWAPWCPPCRLMDQTVFVDPAVIGTIERNFVPVKLNVDHYPTEARQLGVTALPTTVVITPDGQIVESHQGLTGGSEYAARLLQIASAPRRPFATAGQPGPTAPPMSTGGPVPADPAQQLALSDPRVEEQPLARPEGPWNPTPPRSDFPGAVAGVSPGGDPRTVPPQNAGLPGQPPQSAASGPPSQYASASSPPPVPNWNMVPAQGPAGSQGPLMASIGGPSPVAPSLGVQLPGMAPSTSVDPVPSGSQPEVPPAANMAPLALDGYCPVELVENKAWKMGDRRWGATHQGRTYLFSGPEQQRRFLDAPERYSPVNSGNDVVLALDEGQAVAGRREHGVFYGNRIFLFAGEDSLEAFSRQPARYEMALQRANQASRMGNYR